MRVFREFRVFKVFGLFEKFRVVRRIKSVGNLETITKVLEIIRLAGKFEKVSAVGGFRMVRAGEKVRNVLKFFCFGVVKFV